ncbi:hypothetical protein FHG87_013052, partial [Trinorchestia longiramus]
HNYDYLRELVTSDAVAVLANNSSPITSLARSAVRAKAVSPPQRSAKSPASYQAIPKFAKPDIITSNVVSGVAGTKSQLPSPKFTRSSDVCSMGSPVSVTNNSQVSYHQDMRCATSSISVK